MVPIVLATECQGAIAALKIKADFHSKEADENDLHGCWVGPKHGGHKLPIAQFNTGGKKNSGGDYVTPYSEKFNGICKSKGCNDASGKTTEMDYYLQEISEDQYCEACKKGAVTCLVARLISRQANE